MPPQALETLDRKNVRNFVKVLDVTQGIVEMYVAATGNIDEGGDVIEPGAFDDTIKSLLPKGIHGHDWLLPTSKALELEEVKPGDQRLPEKMLTAGVGGMRIKAQYNLETQVGRETFSNVRFYGPEQEWSIGYIADPDTTELDAKSGQRKIKKLALYEFSDVLFGMNPLTATVDVKSRTVEKKWGVEPPDGSFDAIEEDVREAIQDAEGNGYWVSVVATFPDHVVYYLYANMAGVADDDDCYQRTFSRAADGTVTLGDKQVVTIVQTIVAGDPDEKTRPATETKKVESEATKVEATKSGEACEHCGHVEPIELADAEAAMKAMEIVEAAMPILRTKEGRKLAKRNEDRIRAAHANLTDVLSELDSSAADTGGGDSYTSASKALTPQEIMEFEALAAGVELPTDEGASQ